MPDNREADLERARGEYLCIVEDKQVLNRHVLERSAAELRRQPLVS